MKILSNLSLLFLTVFLCSASCKKLDGLLKGDLTCRIDGREWTSYEDDFKLSDVDCKISANGEEIFITATNTKTSEHIAIAISTPGKVVTIGSYQLNSDKFQIGYYEDPQSNKFITGNMYQGTIDIKSIDKAKFRISGSFQFTAFNSVINKSISITDGKFDTDYTRQ